MNRILLVLVIALVAAAAQFAYLRLSAVPAITYATVLGVAGAHSSQARLPELPLHIVFDQARGRVISRQEDGRIVAWDLATGTPHLIARTEAPFGYCPARQLLIVGRTDSIALVDLALSSSDRITGGAYHHVAWSRDCARFALAGGTDPSVEVWRVEGLEKLATIGTAGPVRNGLALSADGRTVAAAEGTYGKAEGHKTQLEVFTLSDGADSARTAAFDDPATITGMWKMVFAPDAESLLVGSQIDAKSGLRSLATQSGDVRWGQDGFESYWVRALAVSPDGDLLATGDEKGKLRLWDVATGEKRFEGQTGLVIQSLSFSEDGKRLAVALWDSTIGIVDVDSLAD